MNTKQQHYAQKAAMYDLLAQYYKYRDPSLHIAYYQKHFKYATKLSYSLSNMRSNRQGTRIRILHASPGAPSVDVYLNGRKTIPNLIFKQETDYIELREGGRYRIDLYKAGETARPLISAEKEIKKDMQYTIIAAGEPTNLSLLAIKDEHTVPKGEAKLRFIHLSPNAPSIDVAAVRGDVIFPNVSFKEVTNYLALTPMEVNIELRRSGSKEVLLKIPPLRLRPDRAYTVYGVGLVNENPPLEALVTQD
ncbi:DUF4397 domain-containing protein [Priestia endophytica]|uniref:DUF4397 domain-containing protein n=1 Tax=Priestia endophytica TaxID=135735 RepID=UPI00203E752A|nr:DUF4397 domain-containing protein [Priestia endophytica]MCM3537058.1 DUF4397 domain-containing protein [Priestia endophytica]